MSLGMIEFAGGRSGLVSSGPILTLLPNFVALNARLPLAVRRDPELAQRIQDASRAGCTALGMPQDEMELRTFVDLRPQSLDPEVAEASCDAAWAFIVAYRAISKSRGAAALPLQDWFDFLRRRARERELAKLQAPPPSTPIIPIVAITPAEKPAPQPRRSHKKKAAKHGKNK